jgi:phospholipase C
MRYKNWLTTHLTPLAVAISLTGTTPVAKGDNTTPLPAHVLDLLLRSKVQHIVVIYQENWSFDSLYGQFPGANGLQNGFDNLPQAIQHSAAWPSTVIIITYDENGGRWDHVTPPLMADGWGLGTRVPGLIVSPLSYRERIDGRQYETVSILKLIERRFGLAPLSARDANPTVADLTGALNLLFGGNQ